MLKELALRSDLHFKPSPVGFQVCDHRERTSELHDAIYLHEVVVRINQADKSKILRESQIQ